MKKFIYYFIFFASTVRPAGEEEGGLLLSVNEPQIAIEEHPGPTRFSSCGKVAALVAVGGLIATAAIVAPQNGQMTSVNPNDVTGLYGSHHSHHSHHSHENHLVDHVRKTENPRGFFESRTGNNPNNSTSSGDNHNNSTSSGDNKHSHSNGDLFGFFCVVTGLAVYTNREDLRQGICPNRNTSGNNNSPVV